MGIDRHQWALEGTNPEIYPPSKVWHPDAQQPMAHPEGKISGVLVKLDMGQKGRLEKSIVDMCCGASGFLQWNLDTSPLEPLITSSGLHSSSLIPYPFRCTRYSSLPLNTQLSRIHSTLYSSTPLQTMGVGGSCCTCLAMVSKL